MVLRYDFDSFLLQQGDGLFVSFTVYPSQAVFKKCDLKPGLEKVLGSVFYAILGGNSGNIDKFGAQKLKHFAKRLVCAVPAVESGILFELGITPLIKNKFLLHEWQQVVMDL